MEIRKKCIQCGEPFVITDAEQETFRRKGYMLPKRCKVCRKTNRDDEKFLEDELLHLVVEAELERRRVLAQTVKHRHFDRPLAHRVRTLFLIGNGFDIGCGLRTRYSDFEAFYEQNKIRISWEMGIEPCKLTERDGENYEFLTQFDLLYFWLSENYPTERKEGVDFWSDFENSLVELDDTAINAYFGKEPEDLKDIRIDCDYAYALIRKCLSEWVKTVDMGCISVRDKYEFRESLFVNFNYTDTLTASPFGVDKNDVIHIHGRADDPESMIFGHGKQFDPDPAVMQFGRRFAGGYVVETILKKFYKDPPAQWRMLQDRLQNKKADLGDVKDVYVLGHSLGEADRYYFRQLKKSLPSAATWHISCFTDDDRENARALVREWKIADFQIYPSIWSALSKFKSP